MRYLSLAAPLAMLAGLSGCGGGPAVLDVTGKVTLRGQPLEGVSMAFVPDPSNREQTPGGATTDSSGGFAALSDGSRGLAPGKYRVGITKWHGTLDSAVKNPSEKPTDDPYQAYLASGGGLPGIRPGPPKSGGKAAKADHAPLPVEAQFTIEVTPEKHAFDFDVEQGTAPAVAPKDPSKR